MNESGSVKKTDYSFLSFSALFSIFYILSLFQTVGIQRPSIR